MVSKIKEFVKREKELYDLQAAGLPHKENADYAIGSAEAYKEVLLFIEYLQKPRYHLKPKSYLFDLVLNQHRADKNVLAGFTIDSAEETDHIKTKFTEDEIRFMPEWCQELDRIEVE